MNKSNSQMPDVFFIRHKLAHKDVEMLRRMNRIAIQFNSESYHQWKEYSKKNRDQLKFKRAWDQFQKIKRGGGIVVAQYEPGVYVLGKVKKGSRLRFLPASQAGGFSLKTLQLHKIRHVTQRQREMISVFKPTHSTLNPIRKGADYVRYAYGLTRFTPSLKFMHYKLQEAMCAEWLRSKHCPRRYRIAYLLANIGHGLEAVDILGQTIAGTKVYAQVTYSQSKTKIAKKRDALLSFSKGTGINILFSKTDPSNEDDEVIHIPLQQVLDHLFEDKKYRQMIREMIGLKSRK